MPSPPSRRPPQFTIQMLPPPGPSISTLYHSSPRQCPQIFADAMAIRLRVFCSEQGCSVGHELDSDDGRSWHWVAYASSSSSSSPSREPIACVRLVPPPHGAHPNGFVDAQERPYVRLTRMAVVAEARGFGLARVLCEEAVGWAQGNAVQVGEGWGGLMLVHAQVRVKEFWARLGFRSDERLGRWDEEGIEHLGMWRQLESCGAIA